MKYLVSLLCKFYKGQKNIIKENRFNENPYIKAYGNENLCETVRNLEGIN